MKEEKKILKQGSIFYKNSAEKIGFTSKISFRTRQKIFQKYLELMKPNETTSVLDVGVTCDNIQSESNYFEKLYPYKNQITCAGVEDGSYLEKLYPGIRFVLVESGKPLPFMNKQFDIVFSNATVEHTGSFINQKLFVSELIRVSKYFFITTPNRWFPVELHTVVPFIHWLPTYIYRNIYSKIGLDFWASEINLNLLDKKALLNLFPKGIQVELTTIHTFGFASNILAYGGSS